MLTIKYYKLKSKFMNKLNRKTRNEMWNARHWLVVGFLVTRNQDIQMNSWAVLSWVSASASMDFCSILSWSPYKNTFWGRRESWMTTFCCCCCCWRTFVQNVKIQKYIYIFVSNIVTFEIHSNALSFCINRK